MILHVDMDAFYASVEQRDRAQLRGRPVVVGGSPRGRGVVAAASYEARRFGVRSAMPSAQAERLCPTAVFVRPRMDVYASVSRQIRAILGRYTPTIEPLALDEAFLDVTASERLFGGAEAIARRIRRDVRRELDLVASVGVAPNKFLAKLAGARGKPDGLVVVPARSVQAFLDPLPVACLWGVGQASLTALNALGVHTVAALRCAPPHRLRCALGRSADRVLDLAGGIDRRRVVSDARARSLSHETTFERDTTDRALLRARALDLTAQVAARARLAGVAGRTLKLKLRYGDFRTVTRARSWRAPTAETDALWSVAGTLLDGQLDREPAALRLIGVALTALVPGRGGAQGDLFPTDAERRGVRLDGVADSVNARFGARALTRAGALR